MTPSPMKAIHQMTMWTNEGLVDQSNNVMVIYK